MGAGSVPRVGTAAWTAARLAWRDRATASAARAHRRPTRRSGRAPVNGCVRRGRARDARASLLDVAERLLAPGRVATAPGDGIATRHRRRVRPARPVRPRRGGEDVHERFALVGRGGVGGGVGSRERGDARPRRARRDASDATGDDGDRASGRSRRPPRRPRRPRRRRPNGGCPLGDDAPTLRPVGAIFTHIVPGETSVTSVAQSTPIDAHGYWSPHVDKANVPEYDVSAVLYLSDGDGVDFAGGALHFMDASGGWKTVTPRRNRLVVFSSGEENVHAVGVVTSGERTTLNLWLTRDPRVAAAEDDWRAVRA